MREALAIELWTNAHSLQCLLHPNSKKRPRIREVFIFITTNFSSLHMTQSALLPLVTRAHPQFSFIYCCFFKNSIRQNNQQQQKWPLCSFILHLRGQCVEYSVIQRENKKCKECTNFIVRRVNKLISTRSVSFHCVECYVFLFSPQFSTTFFILALVIFVWQLHIINFICCSFLPRVCAPNMFTSIVFESDSSFGYQKRIRYELQYN